MPIPISSFLIPRGSSTYFLLEDKYIRGGLQIAVDAAERDAIIELNRKAYMIVITEDDGRMWQLQPDLVTWLELLIGGGGGQDAGPRQTVEHTIPEIPGESYADFTLPLGSTVLVYSLSVSSPCIVQVHETELRLDTNPFVFVATEDHLVDDGTTTMSDGSVIRGRRYHIWSDQSPTPEGNAFFRVLNPAQEPIAVTVRISFKPIES